MKQRSYKEYLQKELLKINTRLVELTPIVEKQREEMKERHRQLWNLPKDK